MCKYWIGHTLGLHHFVFLFFLFPLQVSFARSSLNHDDIFILDTKSKIFQFNGSNSSIQERAKALEVVQYIKDTYHDGKCDIASIGESNDLVGSSMMIVDFHFSLSLSQSTWLSCRGWKVDG